METLSEFEKRSYVVFDFEDKGYALVWKDKRKIGKAEKWNLAAHKRYVAMLK